MEYLFMTGGSRREVLNFNNTQELINELEYRGLPLSLADFSNARWDKYGMAKNNYQHYSVTAYKKGE